MPARAEITSLGGLRGLAAWWVVFYHFDSIVPSPPAIRPFIRDGALAVDLFFVLSGFVIGLSYGRNFASGVSIRPYARFMLIRLARIYPLHLVMLVLYTSIPLAMLATDRPVPGVYSPGYLLQSLLLIQSWGFTEHYFWNVPAWSISAELLFYLLYPFAAWGMASLMSRRHGLLIAGTVVVLLSLSFGVVAGGLRENIPRLGAARCLLECLLGIYLVRLSQARPLSRPGGAAVLAGSAGLVWLYAAGLAPDFAVLPFAFAGLIWSLLDPRQPLSVVLSSPLLHRLGLVSFSTYLVHFFIRDWMKLLLWHHLPPWQMLAIYVAAVLGASFVLFHLVEEPGRRAGRRLADRLFRSAEGSSARLPPVPLAPATNNRP